MKLILGSLIFCKVAAEEKKHMCPGLDDWAYEQDRKVCSKDVCSRAKCMQQRQDDPEVPAEPCFTRGQILDGRNNDPEGCYFGSSSNTCALFNNVCMYSAPKRKGPQMVTISYVPKKKAGLAAGNPGTCGAGTSDIRTVDKYRLVDSSGLKLVAVHREGRKDEPCDTSINLNDNVWELSAGGLFKFKEDSGICITSDGTSLSVSDHGCTDDNKAENGWHFTAGGTGSKYCAGGVPTEDPLTRFDITDLPVAAEGSCSGEWHVENWEGDSAQLETSQSDSPLTCARCIALHHNFACLVASAGDCQPAPDSASCTEELGGEWCAPAPKEPVCTDGHDDWKREAKRNKCDSCSPEKCRLQPSSKGGPGTPCYTQAQLDDGVTDTPHGCDFGTEENTCGIDAHGHCVYSEMGSQPNQVVV